MLEDLLKNLTDVTKQFKNTVDLNEKMKEDAISQLSEEDQLYVKSVEGVAQRFAKDGDISGLINYMNSVQEKIKKDASND